MPLYRRQFLYYGLAIAGTAATSTLVSGCALRPGRQHLGEAQFLHGVASGDPESGAVMLWTRATPLQAADAIMVGWEVALDEDFSRVVRSGETSTGPERDFTVKVDVRELDPGETYFYRFVARGHVSSVGRTRTLPRGAVEAVRIGVFSCSNYPAGYFHAYGEAAKLPDVDAFVHLGDYFYEYGAQGYATARAAELGREYAPDNAGELFTVDDYRRRYALYRGDADLQALHAAAPMIAVWDDHEIANDAWMHGAENHDRDEGDFALRKAAAVQAYFEWMPLRPVRPDREGRIYRSFDFGDLVALHMLDTRLAGRDRQLAYSDYLRGDGAEFDAEGFLTALGDPARSLLGSEQRNWLYGSLEASSARWQVLGQQVLMARMHLPEPLLLDLFGRRDFEAARPLLERLLADRQAISRGEPIPADRLRELQRKLPYNLDAWDGYPAERERLYAVATQLDKELVVLSGDTHNAWCSDLVTRSGRRVGVELATPSVSSPGMESYLGLTGDQGPRLAGALATLIDELRVCELQRRGFLQVDFTREDARARWHFLDTVFDRDYRVSQQDVAAT